MAGKFHLLGVQEYPQIASFLGECQLLSKLESFAAVAQLGRALDCHSRGRGFETRQPLHVAVVQLVEHQIVTLVVEDSSSSGHPRAVRRVQKRTKS